MPEFFKTPAGTAVFSIIAVIVGILIIELNYRYFFKYLLDFLFALTAAAVLSPLFLALAIAGKTALRKKGGGKLFAYSPCLSSGGKTVNVTSYALCSFGGDYLGGYADFLKKTGLVKLPRVLDVIQGKISFVGIRPLPPRDRDFIDDEYYSRFGTRAGLCSPLVFKGGENVSYEQLFKAECAYVKKRELFYDIVLELFSLLVFDRVYRRNYFGENAKGDYCLILLARGEITAEQVAEAEAAAR